MKVAVVHSFYSARQPSGENSVVVDQAEQLARAGYDVELISRATDDMSTRRGYALGAAVTTMTGFGPSPRSILSRFSPDIVHVHNTFPNWGTNWLSQWSDRSVVTLHNYRSICSNGLLFRDGHACTDCISSPVIPAIRHACYRDSRAASVPLALGSAPGGGLRRLPGQSARLIALNARAAELFSRVFNRPVDLVPNFASPISTTATQHHGWIYVGRLGSEKGIDQLLQQWPPSESLDIVGGGPLEMRVRELAAQLPHVRVLGQRPRNEVLTMFPQYTGLVLPSVWRESLPTVILEALATGVPSVLSRHVEAAEEFRNAGASVVFDLAGGNLSAALESLRRSPAMRARASEVYEKRFSPSAWQKSVDRIYGEIAAANR
jgi:glycosyltransferase involved in cell wall biosynthesis